MKTPNLIVRCMAWQESGLWVAACIDLSLAVQGQSQAEVRAKLHTQIAAYVQEAVTVDAEHAESLLARRAPWADRARYAFWCAVSKRPRLRHTVGVTLRRIGSAMARKMAYTEPLPLIPA